MLGTLPRRPFLWRSTTGHVYVVDCFAFSSTLLYNIGREQEVHDGNISLNFSYFFLNLGVYSPFFACLVKKYPN